MRISFLLSMVLGLLSMQLPAQTFTMPYDGKTRTFNMHVPPAYDGSAPYPLVINMHGYGSNAGQQEFYSEMDPVADQYGFLVCYPDGVDNRWNVGFPGVPGGEDDVGFISALVDTLKKLYRIDSARIYATGMSNGGFMSYRLACERPDLFAAIASVTGGMTDTILKHCQMPVPVPVLEMHGTDDQVVPYNGSAVNHPVDSVIRFWVEKNGCNPVPRVEHLPDIDPSDNSTVTRFTYDHCRDSASVVLYRINNGGHTWPGASLIIGTTNQDINGSEEIWKFFSRFPSSGNTSVFDKPEGIETQPIQITKAADGYILTNLYAIPVEVLIFNTIGQPVMHTVLAPSGRFRLSLSHLPEGLYFLKLQGKKFSGALPLPLVYH